MAATGSVRRARTWRPVAIDGDHGPAALVARAAQLLLLDFGSLAVILAFGCLGLLRRASAAIEGGPDQRLGVLTGGGLLVQLLRSW